MIGLGEAIVTLTVGTLFIGTKDLPVLSRRFGKYVGQTIGWVRMGRSSIQDLLAQSEMKGLHSELRQSLDEINSIKAELSGSVLQDPRAHRGVNSHQIYSRTMMDMEGPPPLLARRTKELGDVPGTLHEAKAGSHVGYGIMYTMPFRHDVFKDVEFGPVAVSPDMLYDKLTVETDRLTGGADMIHEAIMEANFARYHSANKSVRETSDKAKSSP